MIFASPNGRIQLKDLKGKSYLAMRFFKRYPLESEKMRIIDLVKESNTKKKKKNASQNTNYKNFEFRTRADRD